LAYVPKIARPRPRSWSFRGWSAPIVAVVLAFVLAAPHTIALLALRRRDALKRRLPFGPYLIAGTLLSAGWFLLA